MIDCQFCGQQLPDNAKFCYKCGQQIICKECGERLVKDAPICVVCGVSVNKIANSTIAPNHVRFSETINERQFEATFTDKTAGNVVETLAGILPFHNQKAKILSVSVDNYEEVAPDNGIPIASIPQGTSNSVHSDAHVPTTLPISSIFKQKGDNEFVLHVTDLKAQSKVDFASRLTVLYIYYQHEVHSNYDISKTELISILKRTGLNNDGSYRAWMSTHKSYFSTSSSGLSLTSMGEEVAKKYLEDVLCSDIKGKWFLGASKPVQTNKTASVNKRHSTPSIITGINLSPENKDSLRDFVSKRSASNAQEYNTIFVYYLERILEIRGITPDSIFTCYKHLGIKPPSNLRQSLFDTRSRKGWIDTTSINDLKITAEGINKVEFDFKK